MEWEVESISEDMDIHKYTTEKYSVVIYQECDDESGELNELYKMSILLKDQFKTFYVVNNVTLEQGKEKAAEFVKLFNL